MRATQFALILLAAVLTPLTTSAQDRKAGDFVVTPREILAVTYAVSISWSAASVFSATRSDTRESS